MTATTETTEERWSGGEEDSEISISETFPTRETALVGVPAYLELAPGAAFWIGEVDEFRPQELALAMFNSNSALDNVHCYLCDEAGESADDGLVCTTEQEAELEALVHATICDWMTKHNIKAPCHRFIHTEKHVVPEPLIVEPSTVEPAP